MSNAIKTIIAEFNRDKVDYEALVDAQIRDHLEWFASEGAHSEGGFRRVMQDLFPEKTIDEAWQILTDRKGESFPDSLQVKVGADAEFVVLAGESRTAPIPALFKSYLLVSYIRSIDLFIEDLVPESWAAMMEGRQPFSYTDYMLDLAAVLLGNGKDIPLLDKEIRRYERIKSPDFTNADRREQLEAKERYLDSLTSNPRIEPVAEIISRYFFDRKLHESAEQKQAVTDVVTWILGQQIGDYIADNLVSELHVKQLKNPSIAPYLLPGLPVGAVVYPHRNDLLPDISNELRFKPGTAWPMPVQAEAMPSDEMHAEKELKPMLTQENSIQNFHADYQNKIAEHVGFLSSRVKFGRTHVHVSFTDNTGEPNFFLNDGENDNLYDAMVAMGHEVNKDDIKGNRPSLNMLARSAALGMMAFAKHTPKRNPKNGPNGFVLATPKRIDIMQPDNNMPTHYEMRHVYTASQFAAMHPGLVSAGVDAFTFSLMETLGSMRLGLEHMKRLANGVEVNPLLFRPEEIMAELDTAERQIILGKSWENVIYGPGLAAKIKQDMAKSRPQLPTR